VVIGDDSDLAAVVLRLVRTDRLQQVIIGFASDIATDVTRLWSLPLGSAAVDLAFAGEADVVPIVRDDVGGVLIGSATLSPVQGTVYVDENRVLAGAAARLVVEPATDKGLRLTVTPRRMLGFGRRSRTFCGRAVQIGSLPTRIVSDGQPFPRPMDRWTFYLHTEPLRLVRGLL